MSTIIEVPASPANYTIGRLGYRISGVIIHTMIGTLESCDATFRNPGRGASAHLGIPCSGSVIHRYVGYGNIAWHCGRFYPDAAHPLANANTIGIEHCDNGLYLAPRADSEYACSAQVLRELHGVYGFPLDRVHVRKHTEVSEIYTPCPHTLDIDRIVYEAVNGTSVPIPSKGDDDMLYVGPWVAKPATLTVFTAGVQYLDPSTNARNAGALAQGNLVAVDGYRFSDSAVQSTDRGAGAGAGPDYIWWHRSDGLGWVPDAIVDTSAVGGAPIGAAVSTLPKLSNYFAIAGAAGGPAPDLSKLATKDELAALAQSFPTKATGNVTLSLSK